MMKKYIIYLVIALSAMQIGCKKFLNITPIDKLTGNNFYKNKEDLDAALTDMYGRLFDKYTSTNFAGATGEFRSGEVIPAGQAGAAHVGFALLGGHKRSAPTAAGSVDKQVITKTATDDRFLLNAIDGSQDWGVYNFSNITLYGDYYKVIQSANILISKVEEGIAALTPAEAKLYIAEASFIRCLCYFQMVRLYGDVIYYTTPYQKDPLPRENMVTVINKCIDDLKDKKNDLPVVFSDASMKGVRASVGSAIGLLMNMYMWNAGFDIPNRTFYYEETAKIGDDLIKSNAHKLLPLEEWAKVMQGRSDESLFELFRTINYNTDLNNPLERENLYSPIGNAFLHYPYRTPEDKHRFSYAVLTTEYMQQLYPDESDGRLLQWFVAPFDQNAETFQLRKFGLNLFLDEDSPNQTMTSENTYMIFRYADAILLRAEALANLGNNTQAIEMLNLVRDRADAPLFPNGSRDNNLKDAIFLERSKELMGEGNRYFDLVRTKRILSAEWTANPLTPDKFERGGWTWPIHSSALANNPLMKLNSYWIGTGL